MGQTPPVELWLSPEQTPFAEVELGLNRAREGATFPQLGTSVRACGRRQGSLCVPSSVHGDCEVGCRPSFDALTNLLPVTSSPVNMLQKADGDPTNTS